MDRLALETTQVRATTMQRPLRSRKASHSRAYPAVRERLTEALNQPTSSPRTRLISGRLVGYKHETVVLRMPTRLAASVITQVRAIRSLKWASKVVFKTPTQSR